MKYVLDTNILIHYVRDSIVWQYVEENYLRKGVKGYAFICEVTEGEIAAFAHENKWGKYKLDRLAKFLKRLTSIPISSTLVKKFYVLISAYSRNRHKSLRLSKPFTARSMGKNDIWIAALAASKEYTLISTDRDFEHLDGKVLNFIYIDVEEIIKKAKEENNTKI